MTASTRQRVIALATRFIVGCVVILAAVGIFWLLFVTREQPKLTDPDAVRPQVAVMKARPVAVRRQWEGFGTAAARYSANVPAQVRGLVAEVPPEIVAGATVQRGQALARLDEDDFREEVARARHRIEDLDAQLAQTESDLRRLTQRLELAQDEIKLAEDELERVTLAMQRESAMQREVDQARSSLLAARQAEVNVWEQIDRIEPRQAQLQAAKSQEESNLRTAQRNLERCTITSPIDGVLQSVHVEPGESIGADQIVARVVDLSKIEIPMRFPAGARARLSVGDAVDLADAGGSGLSWSAEVARIAPEDDEQTRTTTVYVEIEQNPRDPAGLSPGKFVRGMVYSSRVEEQWIVPRRAIQGDRIRLVEDDRVRSERIRRAFSVRGEFPELEIPDDEWIALSDPLGNGALVILNGSRRLADGTRVDAMLPGAGPGDELATSTERRAAERVP